MKYKNYIDVHIHEGKVTSSHLQCLGSFSSVLALLRPTPKTCTRTAQRVILPPHHRDSSFRLPSFFVLDLRPSSSIPFFLFLFLLLQPIRLFLNQRRLMLCSRDFFFYCFQASSHQSSTSSSSSFSSDLFHFFSRIHTSSFSLFTNITTKRWQTLLGTCSIQN